MLKITEDEFRVQSENYAGYCTECDEVTADSGVEPDAEEYECPVCENPTMMGLEQALLCGLVTII